MLLVLVASFLVQECLAFDIPRVPCDYNLTINNEHYYVSDTYDTGETYPTDAHYDKHGNLFYVESGRNTNGFYFDVKMIRHKSTMAQKIYGLPNGISYSIAVDKKDDKVYFGTGRGIYSFNYEKQSTTLVSDIDLKLNMLFVDKDGNKYITESNNGIEELYLLDGKKKIRFHTLEALNELAIDDKNNFYFIKEDNIFVLKSTLSTPVCIGNVSYDGIAQIAIHKGNVFIASENLLFFHENDSVNIKAVQDIPGRVTAIAFDDDGDFVLGIKGKLLKYKKKECYFRDSDNKPILEI